MLLKYDQIINQCLQNVHQMLAQHVLDHTVLVATTLVHHASMATVDVLIIQ